MSRTGVTYGTKDVYEALYVLEADPKAYLEEQDGVYLFEYTDDVKKACEGYRKTPDQAKITLSVAKNNFKKLGVELVAVGRARRRGRKPGVEPAAGAGRKKARPGGKRGKSRRVGLSPADKQRLDEEVRALMEKKLPEAKIVEELKARNWDGRAIFFALKRVKGK
ncbi:MAG: hypothetical protein Kow0059_05180 [Candidatus Sumerlaeia bacterium]